MLATLACVAALLSPPQPAVFVHYLPWYKTPAVRGSWGWHWTMNHVNPDHLTNGLPDLASNQHPLVGPYDSTDPDLVDCQALLMKFAGVKGVIIDWYGPDDLYDYPENQAGTESVVNAVKRAGLSFAIMYEDQTVTQFINNKRWTPENAVDHASQVVEWLRDHFFGLDNYLKWGGKPVFMVFGPQYFHDPEQWRRIFEGVPVSFFTEREPVAPAVGAFDWPLPQDGEQESWKWLDEFCAAAPAWKCFVPTIYPRFDDVYAKMGQFKSYPVIRDDDGKTFRRTLEKALASGVAFAQVATWNDYGEGTEIEPTVEYGYRDLEVLQARLHAPYKPQDLRLPVRWYELKKRGADPAALARAREAMFQGDAAAAERLLSIPESR